MLFLSMFMTLHTKIDTTHLKSFTEMLYTWNTKKYDPDLVVVHSTSYGS